MIIRCRHQRLTVRREDRGFDFIPWPLSVLIAAPDWLFQSLTVLSNDADASVLLSGEKASPQIELASSILFSSAPNRTSRKLRVSSVVVDTSRLLSGEKAIQLTEFVFLPIFHLFWSTGEVSR